MNEQDWFKLPHEMMLLFAFKGEFVLFVLFLQLFQWVRKRK